MEEILKIEQLISEKSLAEGLGISKSTLHDLRQKGLPWFSLAGKVFYHEQTFMEWVLKYRKRVADALQNDTEQ